MRCIPCEQAANEKIRRFEAIKSHARKRAKAEGVIVAVVELRNGLPSTRAINENGYDRLEKVSYYTPDYN